MNPRPATSRRAARAASPASPRPVDARRPEGDARGLSACGHRHDGRIPRYSAEAIERADAIFRAAGDPARLRLLELLLQGELCVTELAATLGDGLSTISQRLRVLRTDGLVARRREGKHLFYALHDQHVVDVLTSVLEHAVHAHQHDEHDHDHDPPEWATVVTGSE